MRFELLGNIISIQKGRKCEITKNPSTDSERLIRIGDLRNDDDIVYTNDKSSVFISEEDLTIAWDGANAGTIGFGKRGYIGSTIAAMKKNNPDELYTPYLGKFLQTQFDYLNKHTTGATIPHIDRKILEQLRVPIPSSFSEQIKIATVLIKAESLINHRKESINLLDEFLKSTFLKMFGNPSQMEKSKLETFEKYIEFITSGSRGWAKYYSNAGAKFLRIQNVWKANLRLDDLQFVNAPDSQESVRTKIQEGDLLLSVTADLGRTAVVPKDFGEAYISQHLVLIRLNKDLNPMYAAYYFFMPFGYSSIQKKNKSAVKAGLNFNDIRSIKILVPPNALQGHFAEIVKKTESHKQELQNSLVELEKLYFSLSQRAFKNRLNLSSMVIEMGEEYFSSANDRTEEWEFNESKVLTAYKRLDLETKEEVLSWEALAKNIKEHYKNYHFNFEMLLNFMREKKLAEAIHYYASEELKTNPRLNEADDLKAFIQSAVQNVNMDEQQRRQKNPFINLIQSFYNAEEENFSLTLRNEDINVIKNKEMRMRSGIYFRISTEA